MMMAPTEFILFRARRKVVALIDEATWPARANYHGTKTENGQCHCAHEFM